MGSNIKITKRAVDGLKPTGKRYAVMDTVLKGFCVRVSATGSKTYGFRYRVGGGRSGRSRWLSIGGHGALTPEQARGIARGWATQVAMGSDPAALRDEQRAAPVVSELLERYLQEHVDQKNKSGTARNIRSQISRYIQPALGALKVADVTRADISKFHTSMVATPYAANRALALLSKVFNLAELWGLRPDHSNPCTRVQRYKEKSRERFLNPAEFARLGAVLSEAEAGTLVVPERDQPVVINPQAIPAIRLLILTGARVGEILGLRWEWINREAQRAELPDSKTGKKLLYLSPEVFDLLSAIPRPADGKGFVIRGGNGDDAETALVNIKDPWARIRAAAGLEDLRLHDLRHSFASMAVTDGIPALMVGALLGHRDVKTTARYVHLAHDPKTAAAAQVSGALSKAMLGENKSG